jgi:hypothetical protein
MALSSLAPTLVLAAHLFTDVPNGGFHNDISRIAGAGITAGCTPTTYCPNETVTRGQMAAFLNRTGGRVAYNTNGFQTDLSSSKELGAVTIRAGNVQGGTASIALEASGYTFTSGPNETGCVPCTVTFQISKDGGGSSLYAWMTVHNLSVSEQESSSGAISWVVGVPTGVDLTFRLNAARYTGSGNVSAIGSLTATYVPFGPTGGNAPAGAGQQATPDLGDGPTP